MTDLQQCSAALIVRNTPFTNVSLCVDRLKTQMHMLSLFKLTLHYDLALNPINTYNHMQGQSHAHRQM